MKNFASEDAYQKAVVEALEALDVKVQVHNDVGWPDVPDLSIAGNGKHGWVELKWLDKAPKSIKSMALLTKGQRRWLEEAWRKGGGNTWLLIGTPTDHYLVPGHCLMDDFAIKMNWSPFVYKYVTVSPTYIAAIRRLASQ